MKLVNTNHNDWFVHLTDALWENRTTYKTILGLSPYRIVYEKECHLPLELENISWWGIKKLNFDHDRAQLETILDMNELEEIQKDISYINSSTAKSKQKRWHDQGISRKELHIRQKELLYDSRLHLFLGKLKLRWKGPYIIHSILPLKAYDIINLDGGGKFRVNGHRLKP